MREWLQFRRDSMTRDLGALVSIPTGWSHQPGVETLQRWFARRFQALGATIERIECETVPGWLSRTGSPWRPPPLMIARRARSGRRVLLCGHADTVHPVEGAFKALTLADDGTATGPGCVDMKGGLVVMLAALEAAEAASCAPAWTVILVPDEESGSAGSGQIIASCAKSCDLGLVYEPATPEGGLVKQRPGSGAFLIEARGISAHAGRDPQRGISAVKALCQASLAVLNGNDLPGGMSLNIGPLRGGEASNIIPDHARAWGNVRFRDEPTRLRAEALFNSIEHGSASELPMVRIERAYLRPPLDPASHGEELRALAHSCLNDLGLPTLMGSTGGVSDANNIASAGVPVLDGLGPRGGNMHRNDEFIVLESLAERAELSAILLGRIAAKG